LFSNALESTIIICLKCKEKITNPFAWAINLIDDDFGIVFEFSLFTSNIKREICGVLDPFLFLKRRFEERKAHNMSLMLNPRFKTLCLVFSFVD
jgi:hypothetical protein